MCLEPRTDFAYTSNENTVTRLAANGSNEAEILEGDQLLAEMKALGRQFEQVNATWTSRRRNDCLMVTLTGMLSSLQTLPECAAEAISVVLGGQRERIITDFEITLSEATAPNRRSGPAFPPHRP